MGVCTTTLSYIVPTTVNDNCAVDTVVRTAGTSSGSVVSVGEYMVTFTASDFGTATSQAANGVNTVPNTASCTTNYIVKDHESPKITCPANIVAFATTCSVTVSYVEPTISDNCVGSVLSMTSSASTASGKVFEKGTTTVAYSVTDTNNNVASCSFTISVNDVTVPQIGKFDFVIS